MKSTTVFSWKIMEPGEESQNGAARSENSTRHNRQKLHCWMQCGSWNAWQRRGGANNGFTKV